MTENQNCSITFYTRFISKCELKEGRYKVLGSDNTLKMGR